MKKIQIHISNKLEAILEKISNKSELARKLLKCEHDQEDLVDDYVNFISVSKEDPTKLTYLTDEKIYKAGVEKDDFEEIWKLNKIPSKPGVAFKKLFKNIHEKDVEIFTNLLKASVSKKDFELSVIKGHDMVQYYSQRSYNQDISGTLHNSCMRYDNCQEYFDVYTKNPDICQMLIMLDNRGRLLGRALLWNAINTETNEPILIMDRIYCVDDSKNINYFKEWADNHGYLYKKEQKWQNSMFFESKGQEIFLKVHVKVANKPHLKYPYVDTFKFWDEKHSNLCNYLPKDNGYIRTLMSNDGTTKGGDYLGFDSINRIYVNREHLTYLPYADGSTHVDNTIWSETMQTSISRNHSYYDELVRDYVFNEQFNKFNDKVRYNARREQIRRITEEKSKRMVSSRMSRGSNSLIYNGYAPVDNSVISMGVDAVEEISSLYKKMKEKVAAQKTFEGFLPPTGAAGLSGSSGISSYEKIKEVLLQERIKKSKPEAKPEAKSEAKSTKKT